MSSFNFCRQRGINGRLSAEASNGADGNGLIPYTTYIVDEISTESEFSSFLCLKILI